MDPVTRVKYPTQAIKPTVSNHTAQGNFTIKTSKKWVLPPRPKPGRKPVENDPAAAAATSVSTVKADQQQDSKNDKLKPKSKRGRKPNSEKLKQAELSNNPLRQAVMKINEENYYLKLEVIKLVSDLKSLKNETEAQANNNNTPVQDCNQEQQQEITSFPMTYNTTSNKTINNNTIYRINSNSSTNASTPMMTTTSSSSPMTTATTPPPMNLQNPAAPCGKKRPHDEDINNLILSLIDLNHTSSEVSPLTSNNLNTLHSEQIVEATVKKLNDKKLQQQAAAALQHQQSQQDLDNGQNFSNFLDLDSIDESSQNQANAPVCSSPHLDADDLDIDSSLTPNSFLSLTKTNSTIDDLELDHHHHHHHTHHSHHHFNPKLIDIPEIVDSNSHRSGNGTGYEFSFWKSDVTNDNITKNVVFNTNSTLDELIMERQREREQELLNYNEFNDLIDFETIDSTKNKEDVGSPTVIFNDDWRLDDDNLLNF